MCQRSINQHLGYVKNWGFFDKIEIPKNQKVLYQDVVLFWWTETLIGFQYILNDDIFWGERPLALKKMPLGRTRNTVGAHMPPTWGAHGAHMQAVGAHVRPDGGVCKTHFFISEFKRVSPMEIFLVTID